MPAIRRVFACRYRQENGALFGNKIGDHADNGKKVKFESVINEISCR